MGKRTVAVPAGYIAKGLSLGMLNDSSVYCTYRPEDGELANPYINPNKVMCVGENSDFIKYSKCGSDDEHKCMVDVLSNPHFLITTSSLEEAKELAKTKDYCPLLAELYYDKGADGIGAEISAVNGTLRVMYTTDPMHRAQYVNLDIRADIDEVFANDLSLFTTLQSYLEDK